jgi:spermidine synthase
MSGGHSRVHAAHLLVAGVSGLAVTVLEFGAVRFMAPWFGQSNYVWSNVIGVILLALSLGYWIGGRIADRSESGAPLFTAYLLAAAWAVGIAFLGPTLCAALVPQELGNQRLLPLAFTGSLVATVLLFAPTTLVLGMTSPFLIRLDDAPGWSGRTAGRIFAVGTLGSLAGCYVAPLWLLQAAGSRNTILLCAGALAAMGALGLLFGRRRVPVVAGLGALLVLAAGGTAAAKQGVPLRVDEGQLEEVESAYQVLRVAEEPSMVVREDGWALYGEVEEVPTRFLRHDEDADTYQSVVLNPPSLTDELLMGGRYYDHMTLGAYFPRERPIETFRVLVIGYAGGSLHRALRAMLPSDVTLDVLGVEIDPAVVEVARRHLWLEDIEGAPARIVTGEDGRTVINALGKDRVFDLILVDAYAKTTYVPFQLATVELFEQLSEHLAPDGWIGLNLHADGGLAGRVFRSVATTLDAAPSLGPTWVVPNPNYPGSLLLWATHAGRGAPRLRGDVELPLPLTTPAFALERLMIRWDPARGGHVLTDDRSDVDRLADREFLGR